MLAEAGFVPLRGVVPAERCAAWCASLAAAFAAAPGRAASLRLRDVPGLDAASVWRAAGACLGPVCAAAPGVPLLCDVDECWARRQGGPSLAPHSWHQDGALRFDFAAHPEPTAVPDAVLPMWTCWIALTPCGVDAPGLELRAGREAKLWSPAALAGLQAHAVSGALVQPELAAGDVLVFRGDTLHRTHVTPGMRATRISLELRLFAGTALPARLRGDRALRLPTMRGVGSVE